MQPPGAVLGRVSTSLRLLGLSLDSSSFLALAYHRLADRCSGVVETAFGDEALTAVSWQRTSAASSPLASLAHGDMARLSLDSLGSSMLVGFCSESTCADSDRKGLASASWGRTACCCGPDRLADGEDSTEAAAGSVSLADFVERARHFQKRELALLFWRGAPASTSRRSAQYPSGNQTYSNPSRGGRGGSTPNEGGGDAAGWCAAAEPAGVNFAPLPCWYERE